MRYKWRLILHKRTTVPAGRLWPEWFVELGDPDLASNSSGFWGFVAIALHGLQLISGCVLLHRKEFTQREVRTKKILESSE
jgi:hypothetical protein